MDYSDRGNLQQLFVDSLRDYALVVLDVDGKVLTWNAGASALLGYAESEVIGRHFSCLYTQNDIDAGKPLMSLAGALAQGRHDDTGQRLHKDGTRLETQSVLIPLYDPQKKLVAFGNLTREIGPATGAVPGPAAGVAAAEVRKKVLLVDDDEAVRTAAVGLLDSLGYDVIVASGGAEALDMLTRIDDIDVLFTDVVMPGGMDGGEVAERAQLLRPGLKFLFASGYFEPALVRKGSIAASTHFLAKPYRKKELALKMEQVLGLTVAPSPAAE
jgi:PAS domain S-box-containing protein